jgi:hypothetical protein
MRFSLVAAAIVVALSLATQAWAVTNVYDLKSGAVELKSAGPMAFGPDGVLFVGDPAAATVFAIETGDAKANVAKVNINVPGFDAKLAEALGTSADKVQVADLAVNPQSGNVYLSISISDPKQAALAKVDADGKITKLSLGEISHSKAVLENAPSADAPAGAKKGRGNPRNESITDLAYVNGRVLVSGLAGGDSPSTLREFQFPFNTNNSATNVEIFHGNHGRVEDSAAVRAFIPITIASKPVVLAGYTCTPLVMFPLDSLEPGKKVRGKTVAELGNHNQPLDMIVYTKGDKEYLLMSNNARGVMKISTENIQDQAAITERVSAETAGQPFETVKGLEGVVQLDKLNDAHAIVLVKSDKGIDLKTIDLP